MGNGEWGMGNREWRMENGELAAVRRERRVFNYLKPNT